MSIAHNFSSMENGFTGSSESHSPVGGQQRLLHRIADARRRQGVSLRSVGAAAEQVGGTGSPAGRAHQRHARLGTLRVATGARSADHRSAGRLRRAAFGTGAHPGPAAARS